MTGGVLERMVLPALDEGGYAWKAQVRLGKRLGTGAHKIDAVADPSDLPQRKARRFLNEHLQSQDPFTRQQLQEFAGWTKKKTFDTYWSKQIKPFVVDIGGGQYRVSEAYRPYTTWKRFQRHVTQVRPIAADYTKTEYERVIVYEFFMPLTNETALRTTLDALFFKDNVIPKLKAIGLDAVAEQIPREPGEGNEAYLARLCG